MEVLSTITTIADFGTVAAAVVAVWYICEALLLEYEEWRARRRGRIEAELEAKSEQLRQTILSLAEDLASDREDASRQLTRAMFLTTGRNAPPRL